MPEDNSTAVGKIKKGWIIFGVAIFIFISLVCFVYFKFKPFIDSYLNPPTGRINILILGKGGAGHEAPDLTDTIMFASIGDNDISLISLPRDLWVSEIRAKLNSAYYWGKEYEEGYKIVDESVARITGQDIDYNFVLDFSVFKSIVDSIGGIEVDVQNSFVDEKYPIPGRENDPCDGDRLFKCRYETIGFAQGKQFMDGETALKFVRSRNAEGDEGTDIAREKRQQLIASAIQKKILSPEVYLSPKKIRSLLESILMSLETDLDINDFGGIVRKIASSGNSTSLFVLPGELLVNPPISERYDNQYVFVTQSGDWEEVKKWIDQVLH